jgi:hypothetical protein
MKTAYSLNNSQYELLCADLLPRPFCRLFAMDDPLRRVLIFKSKSTLVTGDNRAECANRHAVEKWQ